MTPLPDEAREAGCSATPQAARASGDAGLYSRLLQRARPYRTHLVALFLLELLGAAAVLLTPVPLKIAIDSVIGSRPLPRALAWMVPDGVADSATSLLFVAVGLLLGVTLVSNIVSVAGELLHRYAGEKLVLSFRSELFLHAQRLSLSYHDADGTASSTYCIQSDATSVQNILLDGILPLVTSVLTVGLMFGITLWLDWQLGLVALGVAPILLFVSGRYRQRLRERAREVKRLESGSLAVIQEVLSALRVVKAFGQEERERDRFLRLSESGLRARLGLVLGEEAYGLVVRLTTAVGTAAVLFIGIAHVRAGTISVGDLLLILGYLALLYNPLKTISRKAATLQSHLVSAERAFALLDRPTDVPDRTDARPLIRATGAVRFDHVAFCYEPQRQVLRDVSFAIRPGTRLGIVGATGAGKSTLVNVLMRFYDPAHGQIQLDGLELQAYRLADLRNQFALVLQDTVLFSASIAENIAYARPDASPAEIEDAARAACAHDFIKRLPRGYETLVGERGMRLSGGERQRIALARAFLKDAPILLLDEPTSAVDGLTEEGILEAMERLMHGRTCIIITHRLKPLSACDTVLMLEDGELIALAAAAGRGPIAAQTAAHPPDVLARA